MTAVTMRADQVRKGDKIYLGPLFDAVVEDAQLLLGRAVIHLCSGIQRIATVRLAADYTVTVERPDPDAQLIEVMAKAAYEGWRGNDWDGLSDSLKKIWRASQCAALAAAREAGLLPEVTP